MKNIQKFLYECDIEGLCAIGAPEDEYDSEARIIADFLPTIHLDENLEKTIQEFITNMWASQFDLDEKEINERQPLIQEVVHKISSFLKTEKLKGIQK